MADPRGFLEIRRVPDPERDPRERTADHGEIFGTLPEEELRGQATRCMDCGTPFCHVACPLGNLIPDWNDLVRRGLWREAIDRLHATNNFPEFTGLICPAPCESACVLAINDDPVMIKQVEWAIVERAFAEGWVRPRPPARRSGRSVAVVGSGPAGLAAAEELNAAGHLVTVYERDEGPGGLMRLGVPDFKLEKWMIDRRVDLLARAGIAFRYDVSPAAEELRARHDAVVLATGSRIERGLDVPGRDLEGIHPAMAYLVQRNRAVAGRPAPERVISAAGRDVVVIGGGDTAADCVASAHREGAASVTQLDIYPAQGDWEFARWPEHPKRKPSTYALDEGGELRSALSSTAFEGRDGHVTAVRAGVVGLPPDFEPTGEEVRLDAGLVLLAIGFTGADPELPEALGAALDDRGRIPSDDAYATPAAGVFAAGDARRGQSLIVTAIAEGRGCASAVGAYLSSPPAAGAAARRDLAAAP